MADAVLALEVLYETVRARLAEEQPTTMVVFGWREPGKQVNQGVGQANRVCFVPGAELEGGKYAGARAPGRNPRPLGTLLELCTVRCWAFDGTDPNSELAQWRAARLLHDAVYRAIQLAMRTAEIANLTVGEAFGKPRWVRPNTERAFGAELEFTLTVESMIPDEAYEERTGVQATIGAFVGETQDSIENPITGDLQ